jgi:hypothetical protein
MPAITLCARPLILLVLGAAFLIGPLNLARTQANFDGSWSVLVITEAGDCDRAYRYGVKIERGRIIYQGEAGIDLSGRVDRNGRLSVSIRRGDQSASATGRLSGNRGVGRWKGKSSTAECGGRWEAERR